MTRDLKSAPLMEGRFEDCTLDSLLEVVSMGRQYLAIEVRDDRGAEMGVIFIKSGKLLGAQAGPNRDEDAVRSLLRVPKQARFSVYPQPEAAFQDVRSPVGSISDIIARISQASQSVAGSGERISVMHGVLREFDLLSIVQVVSLGRQLTGIEVSTPAGALVGSIVLKAGRFLSITCGAVTGVAAMRKLLAASPDSLFTVYRTDFKGDLGAGIGALHEIIFKASEPDDDGAAEGEWSFDEDERKTAAARPSLRESLPPPTRQAPRADSGGSATAKTSSGVQPARDTRSVSRTKAHAREILRSICASTRDIAGAALVSMDGSTVACALPAGTDEAALARSSASLFEVGGRTATDLLRDGADQILVRSRRGYVLVHTLDSDSALVLLLNREAKLGLVFLELNRYLAELSTSR